MAGPPSDSTTSSGQNGSNKPSPKKAGSNPPSNKPLPGAASSSNKPPATTPKPNPPAATNPKPNPPAATNPKPNPPAATNPKPNPPPGGAANPNPPPANAVKRPSSSGNNTGASAHPTPFFSGTVAMRLFTREGKFTEGPDDNVRNKPGPILDNATKTAMAHCFHVALALLERSTGHDAFIKVAQNIVTRRRAAVTANNPVEEGLFAGKDINEMPKYVNEFLHKVRTIGVPVCVTSGVKDIYGHTQRWTWGADMSKYDPGKAAVIFLNKGMVQGLLDAADAVDNCMKQRSKINQEIQSGKKKAEDPAVKKALEDVVRRQKYAQLSFDRAVFCMSATLAHEFVHCYTGYLSGRAAAVTPPGPGPDYGPYDTSERGEAGWEWCKLAFGGLAHFWYTKGSPQPLDSGYHIGIPLLMDLSQGGNWREKAMMYGIDHNVVKKIIEMKDWETEYKADRKWIHKLRKQDDKGIIYPEWIKKHAEVMRIWNANNGLTKPSNVKVLAMAQDTDIAFAASLKWDAQITKVLTPGDLKAVKA